jgi:hypothetical protein
VHPTGCMCGDCQEERREPKPEPNDDVRERWAQLDHAYAAALSIAAYRQMELHGRPLHELEAAPIQAGCATLLIQGERAGVPAPPASVVKSIQQRTTELNERLSGKD